MASRSGREVEPAREDQTGLVRPSGHLGGEGKRDAGRAMHDVEQSSGSNSQVLGKRHDWASAGSWLANRMLGVAKAKVRLGAEGGGRVLDCMTCTRWPEVCQKCVEWRK